MKVRQDKLWKSLIEELGEDFLEFHFPDHFHELDLTKGIEFLETELRTIKPDSHSSDRIADKLIKVYTTSGETKWFLIHVEIQGYDDPDFAKRMFQYFYRMLDHYDNGVTALVIYTNRNKAFQPSFYEYSMIGAKLRFEFNTFHLIDANPDSLRASGNAFAFALEIARRAMDIHPRDGSDQQVMTSKIEMLRHYLNQGLTIQKLRALYNFLNFISAFSDIDNLRIFEETFRRITNTQLPMGIEETIIEELKRHFKEEGLEQGLEQGRIQGREEGLLLGKEESLTSVILRAHHQGMDVAAIALIVDLQEEQVEEIIRKHD